MRTDLAGEAKKEFPDLPGVTETRETADGFELVRIDVETKEAAERIEKPIGRYVTITMPKETLYDRAAASLLARFAATELEKMLPRDGTVLVVGLGNRYITADALGTKTAEHILVTRHLRQAFSELLPKDTRPVCSFCTGVLGVTGIETVEIVSAVAGRLRPGAVLVVDSLAAGAPEHPGTVLQMNDTGISPGAGIGNFRASLNKETLGVPVTAIGIPLVVGANALIGEADETARQAMSGLFVTPKDIDLLVKNAAKLLAEAINTALHAKNAPILQNLLQ